MLFSGLLAFAYGCLIYYFGRQAAPIEIAVLLSLAPMWAWLILYYCVKIEELQNDAEGIEKHKLR